MNRLRALLVALTVIGLGVVTAVSASAATSTSYSVNYSVAVVVSISQGGSGCQSPCSFGVVVPGSNSSSQNDILAINSNDPAGFQINAAATAATYTESGTGCTPVGSHTVPASSVLLTPSAVTGGTGGTNGTAVSQFALGTTATNFFSAVPTTTGSGNSIVETVGMVVNAPAATSPNGANCSYTVSWTTTIVAQ